MIAGPFEPGARLQPGDAEAVRSRTPAELKLGMTSEPRRPRQSRIGALSLAAMAHIAAYLAVTATFAATALLPSGPHSVAVTLVHSAGPSGTSAPTPSNATSSFDRLEKSLTGAEQPVSRPGHTAAPDTRLSDLLGEAVPQKAQAAAGGKSASPTSGQAGGAEAVDPYAYASLTPTGAQQAADRGLRDQVARCWRKGVSTELVRLRVVLDERGDLAAPPQILAPSAVPGQRPQAVAEALRAVRACAPYPTGAVRAGIPHELEFR
jgi:hypothetical protein